MPKQILLADDSITIQKVIALTFAGEDYKITSVDNGADAITKAREIRPDIILADVVMPQKNGYEVSAEIKNDPELKNTPVLLLAGTFEPFDEDEAKKAGANGYVIKPFESQSLIQKVKELIAGKPAAPAVSQPQPTVMPSAAPVIQPVAPAPAKAPAPSITPPQVPPIAPVLPKVAPQQVAPVIPSAAPPRTSAPPPVAPAPPAEEDFWGTMMEEVEEKAPKVKPMPVAPSATPASSADVWDMGELEEAAPVAEQKEEELWESFAFEDTEKNEEEEVMEAPLLEEAAPSEEEVTSEVIEAEVEEEPEILEEEHIELVEEQAEVVAEEAVQAPPEEYAFAEEAAEPHAVPQAGIELQPEILQGYEQTYEPEAISMETSKEAAAPLPSIPSPLPSSAALSEDQLRAALSSVSREVIEKIVWEVVPDLAEMLIKEEIKRLQNK